MAARCGEGERHAQPRLGARLREIARDGASAFYTGAVAESLVKRLNALGGLHTLEDFADGEAGANYADTDPHQLSRLRCL